MSVEISSPAPTYYKRISPGKVLFQKASYQSDEGYPHTEITMTPLFAKWIPKATQAATAISSELRLDQERPFDLQLSAEGETVVRSCLGCWGPKKVKTFRVYVIQGTLATWHPTSQRLNEVANAFFEAFDFTDFTLLTFSFQHI